MSCLTEAIPKECVLIVITAAWVLFCSWLFQTPLGICWAVNGKLSQKSRSAVRNSLCIAPEDRQSPRSTDKLVRASKTTTVTQRNPSKTLRTQEPRSSLGQEPPRFPSAPGTNPLPQGSIHKKLQEGESLPWVQTGLWVQVGWPLLLRGTCLDLLGHRNQGDDWDRSLLVSNSAQSWSCARELYTQIPPRDLVS